MSSDSGFPARIGRFVIQEELGRGAMGVVYRALDPTLEREVALKTIRVGDDTSEEERQAFEQRFLTEAKAVARLSHPGIVVVHEAGRDSESGLLYMALEYLRGRTLAQVVAERGPLDWREALSLAARVGEALDHAHGQGIVHRDVKPANVMLLESGELKVMDFGIAKLQASHAHLTSTGQFFGTPLYMSPEQALGEALDGRSDVFSLGSVTYQMLTAQRLFEADSVPRILTRIAYEAAPAPSLANPGVPPDVDAVVLRALAKDPNERYPDAQSFVRDVNEVLAGSPPQLAGGATAVGEATAVSALRPETTRAAAVIPPAHTAVAATVVPRTALRQRRLWPWVAGLAVFAAAGVATALVLSRAGALPGPEPAESAPTAPGPPPTTAAHVVESTDAATTTDARLLIDFKHHYKEGRIRVWVDHEPVLDEQIGGRVTADVAGIKIRSGQFDAELPVAAGRHTVTVQVDWDDNHRFESISGTFREGHARRLKVRIDRFIKNMSLDWE